MTDLWNPTSFDASPGHVIPTTLGKATGAAIDKITGHERPQRD